MVGADLQVKVKRIIVNPSVPVLQILEGEMWKAIIYCSIITSSVLDQKVSSQVFTPSPVPLVGVKTTQINITTVVVLDLYNRFKIFGQD